MIRNKNRYQSILLLKTQIDGRIKNALNSRVKIILRDC